MTFSGAATSPAFIDNGLTVLYLNTVIYSIYHYPKDHMDNNQLGQFV